MSAEERLLKFLRATPEQQEAIEQVLDGKWPVRRQCECNGPLLLGMGAAAKFLGVSRPTLWRMLKAGRLQKVEILPGSFRVKRADLERLVAGKDSRGQS
ncbi:MAG: helix-turn-helix domain-containing protein [Verrucomicrobiae bacterium]|nr:helix-turn-helix domain-containing protein [Verrucomicrobiae bacterium]